MSEGRTVAQRKADTRAALDAQRDGNHVIIATTATSRSARNLEANGIARLALGAPDDVIVIDAAVADSVKVHDTDATFAAAFTAAVGWDPRDISGDWVFFRLTPARIQAYRGYDELEGRDVMLVGRWLA